MDNHSTRDCATQRGINYNTHSPTNWCNNYRNVMYKFVLEKPNISDMNSQVDVQFFIDEYICDINVAFHSSTKHFKER